MARKVEPKIVSVEIDLLVERDDNAAHGDKFHLTIAEIEAFCRMVRREGGANRTTVLFRRYRDNSAIYLRSFVARRGA